MRLSRKLVLILLLVSLVPLAIGAAIAKGTLTHFQHHFSAPRLQSNALAAANGIVATFATTTRMYGTLAEALADARVEGDARSILLRNFLTLSPFLLGLRLVDDQGMVIASAQPAEVGRRLTDVSADTQQLLRRAAHAARGQCSTVTTARQYNGPEHWPMRAAIHPRWHRCPLRYR